MFGFSNDGTGRFGSHDAIKTVIALAIYLVFLPLLVLAQQVDAKYILDGFAAKAKGIHSMSYTMLYERHIYNGTTVNRTNHVQFQEDPLDRRLATNFLVSLGDTIYWSYDGVTSKVLNPIRREVVVDRDSVWWMHRYGAIAFLLALPPFNRRCYDSQVVSIRLESEIPVTLNGVQCYAIRCTYPSDEMLSDRSNLWFIGVQDSLPKKMIETWTFASGGRDSAIAEWTDIQINPDMSKQVFDIPTPEGYTEQICQWQSAPSLLKIGTPAPDWKLPTGIGDSVSLSELRGKVVVLDFWGTWCGHCYPAMNEIQKVHDSVGSHGVIVLGISCKEQPSADPANVLRSKGYTYTTLVRGDSILVPYNVNAFPSAVVIGKTGLIIWAEAGYDPKMATGILEVIRKEIGE